MRWVLRWPVGFCVGVGRKRGSGAAIPGEKGSRGGARGSAHCGVGRDGGGDRSSGDRAAPRGELLNKWGEGGEGRSARETGAAHGGLPRWGGGGFGPRQWEHRGIYTTRGRCDRHYPGWPMGCQRWPT
jgi:hypothetical protein